MASSAQSHGRSRQIDAVGNTIGAIDTAAAGLIVSSGAWTLTGDSTYPGTTTINGGTLQIGAGGTAGNLGPNDIADDGTLIFERSDDITVANALAGNGSLIQNGGDNLTLSGLDTFTGTTTTNAGTITTPAQPLGAPWQTGAVGTTGGNVSLSNGTISITSNGSIAANGIAYAFAGATSDSFDAAYQPLGANQEIETEVTSQTDTNALAKAGVMIRTSGNADSAFVGLFETPGSGVIMIDRATEGAESQPVQIASSYDNSYSLSSGPVWLKLDTVGGVVTGWASTDGANSAQIGQITLGLGASPIVCLATDSTASAFSTAAFANTTVGAETTGTIVPEAPYQLAAEAYSGADGRITWHPQTDATTFDIQESTDGGSTFTTVATAPGWANTYLPNNLTANTSYVFRIQAEGSGGNSPFSLPIDLTSGMSVAVKDYVGTTVGSVQDLGHGGIDTLSLAIANTAVQASSWQQAMLLASSGDANSVSFGVDYAIGNFTQTSSDTGYYGQSFGILVVTDGVDFNNNAGMLGENPDQADDQQQTDEVSFTLDIVDGNDSTNSISTDSTDGPDLYLPTPTPQTACFTFSIGNITHSNPSYSGNTSFSYDVSGDISDSGTLTAGSSGTGSVSETLSAGQNCIVDAQLMPQGSQSGGGQTSDIDAQAGVHSITATLGIVESDGSTEQDHSDNNSLGGYVLLDDADADYKLDHDGTTGAPSLVPDNASERGTQSIAGDQNLAKLTIHMTAPATSTGFYTITATSTNITLWGNSTRSNPIGSNMTFPDHGADVPIYIQGVGVSASAAAEAIQITWHKNAADTVGTTMDTAKYTVWSLEGSQNVPENGQYEYIANVPGGISGNGTFTASKGEVNDSNLSGNTGTANITWGAGPQTGTVTVNVANGFSGSRNVNIVQVQVSLPSGVTQFPVNPVAQIPMANPNAKVVVAAGSTPATKPGITISATVTLNGPNGNRGIDFISAGFLQNLYGFTNQGTYANNSVLNSSISASVFSPILDQSDGATGKWYDTQDNAVFDLATQGVLNSATISMVDYPGDGPPANFGTGNALASSKLEYDFDTYIAAQTSDNQNNASQKYVAEADTGWKVVASGTVVNNVWTSDKDANNNPVSKVTSSNTWTELTNNGFMTTTGDLLNDLIANEMFN